MSYGDLSCLAKEYQVKVTIQESETCADLSNNDNQLYIECINNIIEDNYNQYRSFNDEEIEDNDES